MRVSRWAGGVAAGAALTVATVVGWQAIAAADAGDAGRGHGMRRMHELMESGNPGMARMHEQMMQNDGARQAHESMMPDADMAEMHESMTGTGSPGS